MTTKPIFLKMGLTPLGLITQNGEDSVPVFPFPFLQMATRQLSFSYIHIDHKGTLTPIDKHIRKVHIRRHLNSHITEKAMP